MIGHARAVAAMLAVCVIAVASPARAQAAFAPPTQGHPAVEHEQFADAAVITEDDLGRVAGREDVGMQIAQADQRNTVANNSVVGNSVTGNIAIDGNAFQNLQGLAVISANSGNNVAINSAMNVTINLRPMP